MKSEIKINMFPAGCGDCFLLEYVGKSGKIHYIMIDSGSSTFSHGFAAVLSELKRHRKKIDFLCITHQDDDHIGGLLSYLERHSAAKSVIHEIWMNHKSVQDAPLSDVLLSAKQRNLVYLYALIRGISVKNSVTSGMKWERDGMEITVLAPSDETVAGIESQKDTSLMEDVMLKAHSDYMISLDELARRKITKRDTSKSNLCSIVLLMEYQDKRILFTGDAPAQTYLSFFNSPVHLDVVKLAHHGSVGNIAEDWPDHISCENYLISADGRMHPDKQTVAKLFAWNHTLQIYSHTDWWKRDFLLPQDQIYVSRNNLNFIKTQQIIV